ncbi:hypothetical protein Syun_025496 [Stephania yunnanensis]|uniref:Uncharacterized protein n=1 Tax=Stephania yunnanensis TaxID=152371 RepID=A0AAP0ERS3_9MAGN
MKLTPLPRQRRHRQTPKPPSPPRNHRERIPRRVGGRESNRPGELRSSLRCGSPKSPRRDCLDLKRRLRGHLLNWPRVRNVARVAGDEMEKELKRIVRGEGEEGEGEEKFDALNRRIHERERGERDFVTQGLLLPCWLFRVVIAVFDPRWKKTRRSGGVWKCRSVKSEDNF